MSSRGYKQPRDAEENERSNKAPDCAEEEDVLPIPCDLLLSDTRESVESDEALTWEILRAGVFFLFGVGMPTCRRVALGDRTVGLQQGSALGIAATATGAEPLLCFFERHAEDGLDVAEAGEGGALVWVDIDSVVVIVLACLAAVIVLVPILDLRRRFWVVMWRRKGSEVAVSGGGAGSAT